MTTTEHESMVKAATDEKGVTRLPDGRFFTRSILGAARLLCASDGTPLGSWGQYAAYGFAAALLESAERRPEPVAGMEEIDQAIRDLAETSEWPDAGNAADAIIATIRTAIKAARGVRVPTQAASDVLAERLRQVEREGWTLVHDDLHGLGEMARAAASYALHSVYQGMPAPDRENESRKYFLAHAGDVAWPWDREWWKPSDPRRDLVKAGALIVAEIERLDRAAAPPAPAVDRPEGER